MKTNFLKKLNILPCLAALAFGLFALAACNKDNRPVNPYAAENSFEVVFTQTDDALEYAPAGFNPTFGVVFYTAAFVEPTDYTYIADALAKQGYLAIISKTKYPQAYGSYNPNIPALLKYPNVKFFIGGHDVGGGAAVRHAMDYAENGYNVAGVFLYAPIYFATQKFQSGELVKDEDGNPVWEQFSIANYSLPTLLLETDDALRTDALKSETLQHINRNTTDLYTLVNSSSLDFSTASSSSQTDQNALTQRKSAVEYTLKFMLEQVKASGIYKD